MNKRLQQTGVCYYSEKIKFCGHAQKGIYKISLHLMGNDEERSLSSDVPAKTLAHCFSDL